MVLTFLHLFDRHEISLKYDEAFWTQFARNTQPCVIKRRLRVVPIFSSGAVERAKREPAWKSPHAIKARRLNKRQLVMENENINSWK